MNIFCKRLKQARLAAGLSQEKLGVLAGLDEMSASARMNQYERGKHEPDFTMVERLAIALDLPESYFYAKDDMTSELLTKFHRMTSEQKLEVLRSIEAAVDSKLPSFP
jgi:transcriptional regulator with XRE-family HTH domain